MKMCVRFCGFLLLLAILTLASASNALAVNGSPLAGTWRVILFSTPSSVTFSRNAQSRITGINQGSTFEYGSGRITIDSVGNLTGTFSSNGESPESLTGTAIITSQGKVTVAITGDEEEALVANVNAAYDFMVSCRSLGDVHDAMFFLKEPAAVNSNDLQGNWGGFGFETPSEIKSLPVSQPATSVTGLDKFGLFSANLTVNGSGGFSGFLDGAFTGSYSSYSSGVLSLTVDPDDEGPFIQTFFINASKTVMMQIIHHDDFVSNELIVFVRQPTVTPDAGDMIGHWNLGFLATPSVMTPVMNSGFVTDLNGKNNFEVAAEKMTFGTGGNFTAKFVEGPKTGTTTGFGTDGNVEIFILQDLETANVKLNSTGDIFYTTFDDSSNHQFVFALKSPPYSGISEESGLVFFYDGSQFKIYWAASPGRFLQESTDLVTWTTVSDTLGAGSYTPGVAGNKYYRVVNSP